MKVHVTPHRVSKAPDLTTIEEDKPTHMPDIKRKDIRFMRLRQQSMTMSRAPHTRLSKQGMALLESINPQLRFLSHQT